jgi:hypothetical protein
VLDSSNSYRLVPGLRSLSLSCSQEKNIPPLTGGVLSHSYWLIHSPESVRYRGPQSVRYRALWRELEALQAQGVLEDISHRVLEVVRNMKNTLGTGHKELKHSKYAPGSVRILSYTTTEWSNISHRVLESEP